MGQLCSCKHSSPGQSHIPSSSESEFDSELLLFIVDWLFEELPASGTVEDLDFDLLDLFLDFVFFFFFCFFGCFSHRV